MSSSATYAPTPQIPMDLAKDIVEFKPPSLSFVLHNARKKPIDLMYQGNLVTVPAVNRLGTRSAIDADGKPVPGTLVVEDIWGFEPETGNDVLILNAKRAVKHWLGLTASSAQAKFAEATSNHARAGLTLLPNRPPRDLWMAAAADGAHRSHLMDVERANEIVDEYDSKNAIRKARGMEAVSPGLEYARAKLILDAHNKLVEQQVAQEIAPHEQQAEDEQFEMEIAIETEALRLAEEKAKNTGLDAAELAKRLLNNKDVRKKLEKDWQIRKRGHRKDADLNEEMTRQAGVLAQQKADDMDEDQAENDSEG